MTLIFSGERYGEVIDAYLDGLDAALVAGRDISDLHSVASFFVSRVDTEIDKRLEVIGTPEARPARQGCAGQRPPGLCALPRCLHREVRFPRPRDAGQGARPQRALWASTGTKNKDYADTLYVSGLVAPDTVNTMPGATMEAFADHGWVDTASIIGQEASARASRWLRSPPSGSTSTTCSPSSGRGRHQSSSMRGPTSWPRRRAS